MGIEQNTVHRKEIIPWYESDATYIIVALFMFFVFLFSILGIIEASDSPEYYEYVWVPILLMSLSGGMFFSAIIRLVRQYFHKDENTYLTDFRQDGLNEYGE